MIEAMIFDLDGTLVQTEKLKALSYARAAVELCPRSLSEEEVVEAFKTVVGRSRREVAKYLVERFDLAEKAAERSAEFGVNTAWQSYIQVRLAIYEEMTADPEIIRQNQWPHNMALLEEASRSNCKVSLATMSHCDQVQRILEILNLVHRFDFIATRDDVARGKPDPEIYHLVSAELEIKPGSCLVIEDSPSGVEAAIAAGMKVVAVATPFTRQGLKDVTSLPEQLIIEDPSRVSRVVSELIKRYAD
jgi:beta-phosphoglucomutase-like phosphatase (HAD superfamily)